MVNDPETTPTDSPKLYLALLFADCHKPDISSFTMKLRFPAEIGKGGCPKLFSRSSGEPLGMDGYEARNAGTLRKELCFWLLIMHFETFWEARKE